METHKELKIIVEVRKQMSLKKIKNEDLIFQQRICGRISTCLTLDDYDWMNYRLCSRFKTKENGALDVKLEYFGEASSLMNVKQTINGEVHDITYKYPSEIFSKNITRFLEKHIKSWKEEYAFSGEEEVIDFFNEVIEKGTVIEVHSLNE